MSQETPHSSLESTVNKIFHYQRRQKYWQIAKFIFFTTLIASIGLTVMNQVSQSLQSFISPEATPNNALTNKKHVALIELRGVISGSFDAGKKGTADNILSSLRKAFSNPNVVAIVLRINSPGGAAVQSAQLYDHIQRLRTKYPNIPIYAVCEEVCASAAYHIACACHEIYASSSSIIGSLGTTLGGVGFGYEQSLKKLGIERRLITSGERKGMLDPYSPLKKEDVEILKEMQKESHQLFIEAVKAGRKEKLQNLENNEAELFSGRFWMGTQALRLGLIDQLGDMDTILEKLEVEAVNYSSQSDWLLQLKQATGLGLSMHQGMLLDGLFMPLLNLACALQGIQEPLQGLL